MNRRRLASTLVGFAIFLVGALTVVLPGTRSLIPVEALLALAGNDYLLVAVPGVVAVVVLAAVLIRQAVTGVETASTPPVEGVPTGEPPGSDLDALFDGGPGGIGDGSAERRERVRRRLRRAAIDTLARQDGCSRPAAAERVATGDWTDDEVAAATLAEERADGGWTSRSARGRFRLRARRTAEAIARLSEGEES